MRQFLLENTLTIQISFKIRFSIWYRTSSILINERFCWPWVNKIFFLSKFVINFSETIFHKVPRLRMTSPHEVLKTFTFSHHIFAVLSQIEAFFGQKQQLLELQKGPRSGRTDSAKTQARFLQRFFFPLHVKILAIVNFPNLLSKSCKIFQLPGAAAL